MLRSNLLPPCPLRAALYIRVSTHSQEELSPDSQKRLLLDYARAHDISVDPVHIYLENGISGRRADRRPQFQRMIAAAKAPEHPFDLILVWKFSRFARNQEESIVYKSMLQKTCSVEVVSISEPLADGPFGSLIERIIEWMDEFYSIRLSGDVFRGMAEKALRGGYQCRPPLGYRIPGPGPVPAPVPEEAKTVALIFHAYGNGTLSLGELTRLLNSAGLRTARGNLFEPRAVRYILENPFYAGQIRWNRAPGNSSRPKPREQWITGPGNHLPIVSPALFDRVQRRLAAETPSRDGKSSPKPPQPVHHWLSGLVKCPACGRSLASCIRRRKTLPDTFSFQCSGYLKGKCGLSCYLTGEAAETSFFTAFCRVTAPVLSQDRGSRFRFRSRVSSSRGQRDPAERELLLAGLEQADTRLKRLSRAYLDGIDGVEEYGRKKAELEREKILLEQQLREWETARGGGAETPEPLPDRSAEPPAVLSLSSGSGHSLISVFQNLLSCPSISTAAKNAAVKSVLSRAVYHRQEHCLEFFFRLD